MHQRIYLTGMPGCGKSYWGNKLAITTGYRFIDLDEEIERAEGSNISNIFQLKGETYFRQLEADLLRSLKVNGNTVIALGGGTPCFHNNLEFILKTGLSYYLKASVSLLTEHLKNKEGRPLLNAEESLGEKLQTLLVEREPYYLKANRIIDVSGLDDRNLLKAFNL